MSPGLNWSVNQAGSENLTELLLQCDLDFSPPLSSRVELPEYAEQLRQKAERFEAWKDGTLVGCVAIYCNATNRARAFVSNVSIAPAYRGRGIAEQLLKDAVKHAATLGFERVGLEVNAAAGPALKLYRKLGFGLIDSTGDNQIWEHAIANRTIN